MDLEGKLSAKGIVNKVNMSDRPGYYSGRGAKTTDLNSSKLEKIYGWIEHEHGEEAAQNFVQMVADIPVLSATDFLISLYRLEADNWKWDKSERSKEKGIYPDSYGSAVGTVYSALSGMGRVDETIIIRTSFLRKHGIKVPEDERQRNCYLLDFC